MADIAETTMESFYSSNFDIQKPEVPALAIDAPIQHFKRPSAETRQILYYMDETDAKPSISQASNTKTRFDQFMNFLGNIE